MLIRFAQPFLSSAAFRICAISIVISTGAAHAADGVPDSYRCEIGGAVRNVSLWNGSGTQGGGGCQVMYERKDQGEPAFALWRAKSDMQFCADKLQATITKLTVGGWQCAATSTKLTPDLAGAIITNKQPGVAVAGPVATRPVVASKRASPAANTAVARVATPKLNPRRRTVNPPLRPMPKPVITAADDPPVNGAVNAKPAPEYDDWFYRWDEVGRRLVFTLYNKSDGRKSRSFGWAHKRLDRSATSPSNIVFVQDKKAKPVIIVAWPGKSSQYVTVMDPIRQDAPLCEIETQVKTESGWGFGMQNDTIFLTGQKSQAGQLVEFKETCDLLAK